ncbi:MAG TPA: hypothetical protein VJB11_03125 [archaeon]|nr:hypothetical protein [archaeon]
MAESKNPDEIFRKAYECYEYLKHNYIPSSKTSTIFHQFDLKKINDKLSEELVELRDSVKGIHKDNVLKECSQVFYWASILGVYRSYSYDELKIYDVILDGYREKNEFEIPKIDMQNPKQTVFNSYKFIGKSCRESRTDPAEVGKYEIEEIKKRPYLSSLVEGF